MQTSWRIVKVVVITKCKCNGIHVLFKISMLSARPTHKNLRCCNCTSNGFLAIPDLQGYTIGQLGHEHRQGSSVSCGASLQTGFQQGNHASDRGRPWYGTNVQGPNLILKCSSVFKCLLAQGLCKVSPGGCLLVRCLIQHVWCYVVSSVSTACHRTMGRFRISDTSSSRSSGSTPSNLSRCLQMLIFNSFVLPNLG